MIAVSSVIGYHAFPGLFPGGFVGVDIFFVISGFLITGILVREQERSGRIDLAEFYARRCRRLFPALLIVLVTTLFSGLILLPASGELQSLAKSALAALFFASNIFFALQPSGYFAPAPEMFPLLHTWTLAVEEQFYIVWPLLIPTVARLGRRLRRPRYALWLTFGLVFIISLTLCIVATRWRPNLAFFLTPFRGWEFAMGAMLSMLLKGNRPRLLPRVPPFMLSLSALVLIGISVWGFDHTSAFPGCIALVPTLGAALLLASGAMTGANPVTQLLSARPAVYIGRLSYGWYLWHWPILALVRSTALGQASVTSIVVAVTASFVLSAISFHVVENPMSVQSWQVFGGTRTTLAGGAAMLLVGASAAAAILLFADHSLASSARLQSLADATASAPVVPGIPLSCTNYETTFRTLTPFPACLVGNRAAKRIVMVIGDSHAAHLVGMFDRWGHDRNIAVLPRVRGGCRPFQDDVRVDTKTDPDDTLADCKKFHDAAFSEARTIAATGRLIAVVIGSKWSRDRAPIATAATSSRADLHSTTGLARLVALARAGKFRIVLTRDTPIFALNVPQCLSRRVESACGISRGAADARNAEANAAIAKLTLEEPTIRDLDPSQAICDSRVCHPEIDGVVLFRDTDHLSLAGGRSLEPRLRATIDRAVLGR